MITCGDNGKVIIQLEGEAFNLSVSNEYADFVLRLTSPDARVQFCESDFKIDDKLDGDNRARAERYSEFVADFLKKRKAKFEEDQMLTAEKREASIRDFIEQLKKAGE